MSDHPPETLLLTLSGKDRPGVTSAMFPTLTRAGVEVLDIEQIVLRRRLVLGILVTAPRDWKKLRAAVETTAAELGMTVEVDRGTGDNKGRGEGRSHVTVIGAPLKAAAMAAVAGRIADSGANIDRIERMARYPVTAIDLHVSGRDPDRLRAMLSVEAAAQGVDIAVQPASLLRRAMRLIVMDVDSTLIQGEVIELLAAHSRLRRRGRRGHRARRCAASSTSRSRCAQRVALLAGIPATAPRRGVRRARARAGRPDPGAHPAPARLPLRPGLGRVQPDHRPARRRPRHPLLPRQRARDRRRRAHRPHRRRRRGPGRQGRRRCATSPTRSACPWRRWSRSATAPTTSTCSSIAGLGIAYNAKAAGAARPPTPRSTCPTSTRSCISSASAARRSRPSTPSTAWSRPPRPSD